MFASPDAILSGACFFFPRAVPLRTRSPLFSRGMSPSSGKAFFFSEKSLFRFLVMNSHGQFHFLVIRLERSSCFFPIPLQQKWRSSPWPVPHCVEHLKLAVLDDPDFAKPALLFVQIPLSWASSPTTVTVAADIFLPRLDNVLLGHRIGLGTQVQAAPFFPSSHCVSNRRIASPSH